MLTRRSFCAGAAASLAAALPGAALARPDPRARALAGYNDRRIAWRDFRSGAAQARKTGKPIFMLVHARWCPHCHGYKKRFFDPAVVEALGRFTPVLVDQDLEPRVSARYQTDGLYVPRTMFLDARARLQPQLTVGDREFAHFVNYQDPRALRRLLAAAARHFRLS